jgi:enamine deaminase RidA (YjgF/YER057c/UK114 family)
MLTSKRVDDRVSCSSFSNLKGPSEHFIVIHARKDLSFEQGMAELLDIYMQRLALEGLSQETQIFTRFYLSDIANQKEQLLQSALHHFCQHGAFASVQQCPLNGARLVMLSYHIKSNTPKLRREQFSLDSRGWRNALKVRGANYDLLLSGNFSGYGELDSHQQTNEIFSSYNQLLNDHGMTLLKNAVRTWIYVRDIDNHYMGMVRSRVDYFDEQGLNKSTRYIASTGIEAKLENVNSLVSMDALAISNLASAQIVRMEALDNMSPTNLYGVTFERGSRIDFGDRSHFHISGTASIDAEGNVVHPGDVTRQTLRAIENIKALLAPHGASLTDMAYLIVYVRNITEVTDVSKVLAQVVPAETPVILVEGTVCRPAWLVEIEGVGIRDADNPYPDFF